MWKAIKKDIRQRLLTFEAFNGAFILIPWGSGFVYCGLFNQAYGYKYGLVSLGAVLIVWGIRKLSVNRIKQQAKVDLMVQDAKSDLAVK